MSLTIEHQWGCDVDRSQQYGEPINPDCTCGAVDRAQEVEEAAVKIVTDALAGYAVDSEGDDLHHRVIYLTDVNAMWPRWFAGEAVAVLIAAGWSPPTPASSDEGIGRGFFTADEARALAQQIMDAADECERLDWSEPDDNGDIHIIPKAE